MNDLGRYVAEECLRTVSLTQLGFQQAAEAWLETRRPYLSPKTIHEYKLNIKTLSTYFGDFRLTEITSDQIRAYQRARMLQCGPHAINHECGVLQQMLKRIGRWPELAADYQPLPLPKAMRGRALRDEERARLFRIAKTKPEWEGVYCFALISINTTAGPKEVMTLRLKDVADEEIKVQPEGAKNIHRVRNIPLNGDALLGVKLAQRRARGLGSMEPDHYLFPFRKNKGDTYDPIRHQTTFKTAWRTLRVAANLPGLRLYDLRHTAITGLLEDPNNSEETVEAIAGHIGRATKKIYSHPRREAKRKAVESLVMREIKKAPTTHKKTAVDDSAKMGAELLNLLGKLLKQIA